MLRWIFFAVLEEELTVATQARDSRTTFSILIFQLLPASGPVVSGSSLLSW